MILTNSKYEPEDPEEGGLEVDWLRVKLAQHEFLDIILPSGHRVVVYDDNIRVLEPGEDRHKDGPVIWRK
jgi:hypothetical protein